MDPCLHSGDIFEQIYPHRFPYAFLVTLLIPLAFPFFLTMCQMVFVSIAVQILMRSTKLLQASPKSAPPRQSVLVSLLLSVGFTLGNCVYLYLDVSSMQMLKVRTCLFPLTVVGLHSYGHVVGFGIPRRGISKEWRCQMCGHDIGACYYCFRKLRDSGNGISFNKYILRVLCNNVNSSSGNLERPIGGPSSFLAGNEVVKESLL
jgi:hypothetical protein